jgi:hypothetical protein
MKPDADVLLSKKGKKELFGMTLKRSNGNIVQNIYRA